MNKQSTSRQPGEPTADEAQLAGYNLALAHELLHGREALEALRDDLVSAVRCAWLGYSRFRPLAASGCANDYRGPGCYRQEVMLALRIHGIELVPATDWQAMRLVDGVGQRANQTEAVRG